MTALRARALARCLQRNNLLMPTLGLFMLLVLLWMLLLNSRQERHLQQVVADERARQEHLAASEEGADLGENYTVCKTLFDPRNKNLNGKVLHVVTPTYRRAEQMAELTRLAQTLDSDDGPLHWIVATDSKTCDGQVEKLLKRKFASTSSLSYTLLASPMPAIFRQSAALEAVYGLPRGVAARRAAIRFLLDEAKAADGVLYFADDDNSYNDRLFVELRKTVNVSMFPVGLLRPAGISSPLLDPEGRVTGFLGHPRPRRAFPVDMAGFAVSLSRLRRAGRARATGSRAGLTAGSAAATAMPYRATQEEDGFLRGIGISYSEIEPLAGNCSEVLVWHTMTAAPQPVALARPDEDERRRFANIAGLLEAAAAAGMTFFDDERGARVPLCRGEDDCSGRSRILDKLRGKKDLPIF